MDNHKIKILIVEDELIEAMDLKNTLLSMGYSVTQQADTGENAIEEIKRERPDIVFMDIELRGEMTGFDAARIIYSHYKIPVIYLTAHSDQYTLKQAAETEPYGYLLKPFNERELKIIIEVAIFKHRMETELRASELRFKEIFEQNADAIILFKRESFEILDLNPAAVSIFEYPKEKLFRDFSVVFEDVELFSLLKKEIREFFEKESGPFFDRCILHRQDLKRIICSIHVNLIKLQNHEVFYCVFHDITEHVKIEEESRELQSKLIQTNRMTSLGTLASGLAHEINNPNNYILANTQIIQRIWVDTVQTLEEKLTGNPYEKDLDLNLGGLTFTEAKEIVPQLLQAVVDGSRRIKFIIDNLRDFYRPKEIGYTEKVSINRVLEFSVNILEHQIKKLTERFTVNTGENIPEFPGNPHQLEQVLINLIQNALQSLPDRSCGVTVSSSFDANRRCVTVCVCDQGIGIERKILHRITEPFFTTKQAQGGSGLGLYISYSIIKAHQGTIEFISEHGNGTTATIKIPLPMEAKFNELSIRN